jgi:hypothetical protein
LRTAVMLDFILIIASALLFCAFDRFTVACERI